MICLRYKARDVISGSRDKGDMSVILETKVVNTIPFQQLLLIHKKDPATGIQELSVLNTELTRMWNLDVSDCAALAKFIYHALPAYRFNIAEGLSESKQGDWNDRTFTLYRSRWPHGDALYTIMGTKYSTDSGSQCIFEFHVPLRSSRHERPELEIADFITGHILGGQSID